MQRNIRLQRLRTTKRVESAPLAVSGGDHVYGYRVHPRERAFVGEGENCEEEETAAKKDLATLVKLLQRLFRGTFDASAIASTQKGGDMSASSPLERRLHLNLCQSSAQHDHYNVNDVRASSSSPSQHQRPRDAAFDQALTQITKRMQGISMGEEVLQWAADEKMMMASTTTSSALPSSSSSSLLASPSSAPLSTTTATTTVFREHVPPITHSTQQTVARTIIAALVSSHGGLGDDIIPDATMMGTKIRGDDSTAVTIGKGGAMGASLSSSWLDDGEFQNVLQRLYHDSSSTIATTHQEDVGNQQAIDNDKRDSSSSSSSSLVLQQLLSRLTDQQRTIALMAFYACGRIMSPSGEGGGGESLTHSSSSSPSSPPFLLSTHRPLFIDKYLPFSLRLEATVSQVCPERAKRGGRGDEADDDSYLRADGSEGSIESSNGRTSRGRNKLRLSDVSAIALHSRSQSRFVNPSSAPAVGSKNGNSIKKTDDNGIIRSSSDRDRDATASSDRDRDAATPTSTGTFGIDTVRAASNNIRISPLNKWMEVKHGSGNNSDSNSAIDINNSGGGGGGVAGLVAVPQFNQIDRALNKASIMLTDEEGMLPHEVTETVSTATTINHSFYLATPSSTTTTTAVKGNTTETDAKANSINHNINHHNHKRIAAADHMRGQVAWSIRLVSALLVQQIETVGEIIDVIKKGENASSVGVVKGGRENDSADDRKMMPSLTTATTMMVDGLCCLGLILHEYRLNVRDKLCSMTGVGGGRGNNDDDEDAIHFASTDYLRILRALHEDQHNNKSLYTILDFFDGSKDVLTLLQKETALAMENISTSKENSDIDSDAIDANFISMFRQSSLQSQRLRSIFEEAMFLGATQGSPSASNPSSSSRSARLFLVASLLETFDITSTGSRQQESGFGQLLSLAYQRKSIEQSNGGTSDTTSSSSISVDSCLKLTGTSFSPLSSPTQQSQKEMDLEEEGRFVRFFLEDLLSLASGKEGNTSVMLMMDTNQRVKLFELFLKHYVFSPSFSPAELSSTSLQLRAFFVIETCLTLTSSSPSSASPSITPATSSSSASLRVLLSLLANTSDHLLVRLSSCMLAPSPSTPPHPAPSVPTEESLSPPITTAAASTTSLPHHLLRRAFFDWLSTTSKIQAVEYLLPQTRMVTPKTTTRTATATDNSNASISISSHPIPIQAILYPHKLPAFLPITYASIDVFARTAASLCAEVLETAGKRTSTIAIATTQTFDDDSIRRALSSLSTFISLASPNGLVAACAPSEGVVPLGETLAIPTTTSVASGAEPVQRQRQTQHHQHRSNIANGSNRHKRGAPLPTSSAPNNAVIVVGCPERRRRAALLLETLVSVVHTAAVTASKLLLNSSASSSSQHPPSSSPCSDHSDDIDTTATMTCLSIVLSALNLSLAITQRWKPKEGGGGGGKKKPSSSSLERSHKYEIHSTEFPKSAARDLIQLSMLKEIPIPSSSSRRHSDSNSSGIDRGKDTQERKAISVVAAAHRSSASSLSDATSIIRRDVHLAGIKLMFSLFEDGGGSGTAGGGDKTAHSTSPSPSPYIDVTLYSSRLLGDLFQHARTLKRSIIKDRIDEAYKAAAAEAEERQQRRLKKRAATTLASGNEGRRGRQSANDDDVDGDKEEAREVPIATLNASYGHCIQHLRHLFQRRLMLENHIVVKKGQEGGGQEGGDRNSGKRGGGGEGGGGIGGCPATPLHNASSSSPSASSPSSSLSSSKQWLLQIATREQLQYRRQHSLLSRTDNDDDGGGGGGGGDVEVTLVSASAATNLLVCALFNEAYLVSQQANTSLSSSPSPLFALAESVHPFEASLLKESVNALNVAASSSLSASPLRDPPPFLPPNCLGVLQSESDGGNVMMSEISKCIQPTRIDGEGKGMTTINEDGNLRNRTDNSLLFQHQAEARPFFASKFGFGPTPSSRHDDSLIQSFNLRPCEVIQYFSTVPSSSRTRADEGRRLRGEGSSSSCLSPPPSLFGGGGECELIPPHSIANAHHKAMIAELVDRQLIDYPDVNLGFDVGNLLGSSGDDDGASSQHQQQALRRKKRCEFIIQKIDERLQTIERRQCNKKRNGILKRQVKLLQKFKEKKQRQLFPNAVAMTAFSSEQREPYSVCPSHSTLGASSSPSSSISSLRHAISLQRREEARELLCDFWGNVSIPPVGGGIQFD